MSYSEALLTKMKNKKNQEVDVITIQCDAYPYTPINKGLYYISDQTVEEPFTMNDTVKSLVAHPDCTRDAECFDNDVRSTCEILFDSDRCKRKIEDRTGYIYTLTILKSDRRRKVVISYANWGFYSIWLNDVLLTSLPYSKNDEDATILHLEPGDNYLVTRLDIRRSTIGISLRINVYDYDYALTGKNEYIKYLIQNRERKQVKLLFDYDGEVASQFMLVRTDLTSTEQRQYSYRLTRVCGNERYYDEPLTPYESTLFPKVENAGDLSQLYDFEILSDGSPIYENLLLLSSMNAELAYLEQKMSSGKLSPVAHSYERDIQEKINTIKTCFPLYLNYCFYSAYLYLYELRSVYHLLQHGKNAAYYQHPSLHHFPSELDGQDEQIAIHIPHGLDPSDTVTKYSLCILATTGPDHMVMFDRFSELTYHYAHMSVIFASITGKGITTGSYIGEAAFMDCLHELQRLFPIDADKISIHGTSNGAYATWAIAEAYPHLFAAISPISGCPIKSQLSNLSNIYIYNVHENAEHGLDLYSSYDYPNYVFQKEGVKHDVIQYEHESHTDLYKLLFHPSIVDKLLSHRRDVCPKHIHYLTSNGVHNQAYYITVEGAVSSAVEASFDSTIAVHDDGAVWRITTNKITHMLLEIPPYLHQVSTKLIVNSALVADGYLSGKVRVDCINQYLAHDDACRSLRLWNGGIVSCYQGSVKILRPNVDSHEQVKIMRVAKNLSSPKTNGYMRHTLVQYPIIIENQVTPELLQEGNWIIIGTDYNNEYVKKMIEAMPVSMTSEGFTYNNTKYEGSYSFLCALSNIFNSNACVTVIAYSSPDFMNNNLFLRNMILSSASNGFHPYLNQALLVKSENDYFCAKTMGDDLIPVNQFIQAMSDKESPAAVSWDMSDYDDAISLIAMNVVNKRIEDGALKADGWGGDPNLTAINKEIDAEQSKYLAIEYMNASNGKIAQVFFSQISRYDFCEEQSILFEVIPNDTVVREYLLDLSQISTWKGIIHAVRFDPFSYDTNEGQFELSRIDFLTETPTRNFCKIISQEEAETMYKAAGFKK